MLKEWLKIYLHPELNSKWRIWYFWLKVISKEAFLRHFRLSKSSSRCVDKNDPIKPFFADFSFYLAPNYFIYSVSCGISFITYLLIMFISVCFSSWFVYFSKNCTGNFRKIAFSSKLNLGVLPWSLRKNVSIL